MNRSLMSTDTPSLGVWSLLTFFYRSTRLEPNGEHTVVFGTSEVEQTIVFSELNLAPVRMVGSNVG